MARKKQPDIFKSENVKTTFFPDFPIRTVRELQKAGYQAFFVGGCVRDLLTGVEPKDFDIATNAKPNQVNSLFKDSNIIGRRFRLVHVYSRRRSETVEVATFRRAPTVQTHNYSPEGLVTRDNAFGNFQEDAYRRDFGINALYFDPRKEEIYDFVGGRKDFDKQLIRSVGDPLIRFAEDPVRMLRAARFAAKLDYAIDPDILAAIQRLKHTMINVKPRRMSDEIEKLFLYGYGAPVLQQMLDLGLFETVFPVREVNEQFWTEATQYCDAVNKRGRSIEMPFLLACFLWHSYQQAVSKLKPSSNIRETVNNAGHKVLSDVTDSISVPNFWRGMIFEIWEMQTRFELKPKRQIRTLCEQRGFIDAVKFLELRDNVDDVSSEIAEWWRRMRRASEDEKQAMIDKLAPDPKKRRRKRRRSRNKRTGRGGSQENSTN